MDIKTKSIAAELVPVDDATDPVGSFHAVITSPKLDRDGDVLEPGEWETPLPEHLQIIGDHDNKHIMSTIGSGPPQQIGDKIHVRGTYATTGYAQDARKLINGKHLRHLSVAYREKSVQGKGIRRELINASFVNVPSNTDAVVLESKSADMGELSDETKAFLTEAVKSSLEQVAGIAPLPENLYVKQADGTFTKYEQPQKVSQAPEAPSPDADHADPSKDKAAVLAKAAAFQMTSTTRQYTEKELNNA